ncbi:DUF885 domain-containing protein [Bacteriovoracaceae bacterium]|nr:DUF885 domain-containing protein [Bacteriovoracaceae bacterium]
MYQYLSYIVLLVFVACSSDSKKPVLTEDQKISQYFEDSFERSVKRYPTWQTYLGRKTNYHKLDDESLEFMEESFDLNRKWLKELDQFDVDKLNVQNKLSYNLLKYSMELEIEAYPFRFHSYPLNQMFGYHSSLPSFMINMHQIDNFADAQAYIARIKEFKRVFDQHLIYMSKQQKMKIAPPNFVYAKIISDISNVVKGKPFDKGPKNSTIKNDFLKKIAKLKISQEQKNSLNSKLDRNLKNYFKPAYDELLSFVKLQQFVFVDNKGAWGLPEGEKYYKFRLKTITTTELTAPEIHKTGLAEVVRIHEGMKSIMKKVGFAGKLKDFFLHMKSPKYQYPNTEIGRENYLKQAKVLIKNMEARLPELFNRFPKAALEVKPVESFREKSAGIAFYNGPSMEGNRPGIYYVNLYDMADNPIYKMEALAYHEAIPGHHMQIAIATELKELPKFRRMGGYTAYTEGWGLYSELLPKEIGFYEDPYSDFGRLSMELWRAARLVVDTGIHHYKWSREKAISYLKENTPNADLEIIKGVERYFVMPAQATAYKIGMLYILKLRSQAKMKLGERFDIKQFHDEILKNGAVPLFVLQAQIDKWVKLKLR